MHRAGLWCSIGDYAIHGMGRMAAPAESPCSMWGQIGGAEGGVPEGVLTDAHAEGGVGGVDSMPCVPLA